MPIFQFRFILPPEKQIIFHETRKFTSSSAGSTPKTSKYQSVAIGIYIAQSDQVSLMTVQ
jgi:hypothetical protein